MGYVGYNTGKAVQATPVNTTDKMATRIVVDMRSGSSDDEEVHPGIRYVTHVTLVSGEQFSYCMVGVPIETFGYEQAPTVALVKNSSVGRIRLRSRARCSYIDPDNKQTVTLMNGWLVQYYHSVDEDSCVAMIVDDRWSMTKCTVFGRLIYDPATQKTWYDTTDEATFNRDGLPDCLDSPGGPCFAPGRIYGHSSTAQYIEPGPGQAEAKSRSWRCSDIVSYLRRMHMTGRQASRANFGNPKLTRWVQWGSQICSSYSLPGFARTPKNLKLENESLLSALSIVARRAGPYDITMEPSGWYGKLGFANMAGGSAYSGQRIFLPGYSSDSDTIDKLINNPWAVKGGYVTESIMNYFDDVAIMGDPPMMEKTVTMDAEDTSYAWVLKPAWTDVDEEAFKAIVTAEGNNELAFGIACDRYPDVYCAYEVIDGDSSKPVWASTSKFPGTPNKVKIMETLLSGYTQDEANPRDWNPRGIYVEYSDMKEGGSETAIWYHCDVFDSLSITWDGTRIRFDSLRRSSKQTWYNGDANEFNGETMGMRNLRMTLAMKNDFRISGIAGTGGNGRSDPNNTAYRIESNGEKFTWLSVAEPTDYVFWERENSHPNGTLGPSGVCVTPFPNQVGSSPLFADWNSESSGRLPTHARERLNDVKRIEYAGSMILEKFNPSLKPGRTLVIEGRGINPVGIIKAVTFDSSSQQQTVELASFDRSEIYDIPSAPSNYKTGTSAPTTEKAKPGENYDSSNGTYVSPQGTGPSSGYQEDGASAAAQSEQMYKAQVAKKKGTPSAEGLTTATGTTERSAESSVASAKDIIATMSGQREEAEARQKERARPRPEQLSQAAQEAQQAGAEEALKGKYAPKSADSAKEKFSIDPAKRAAYQEQQSQKAYESSQASAKKRSDTGSEEIE